MQGWSQRRRALVMITAAVSSWLIRHGVHATTDSVVTRLVVNLALLVVLLWLGLTLFRVLLRESEDEAKRNPRPW